ncbi:MAG TPA: ATP-binding cassette domain-containing protein, partial [Sneathiellales bacterium]|nr:ATP-binding cassette domain-containing protein [Sneathiellales bacterium]
MLETRNLSVRYGHHRAVEGVTITVAKNEIVVMLGANGAGKSTFLRAIAGLGQRAPES